MNTAASVRKVEEKQALEIAKWNEDNNIWIALCTYPRLYTYWLRLDDFL